jgi:hypothetical protein
MKNMTTIVDNQKIGETARTAALLVENLRELVKSDNPLLSDIALELLEKATPLEQRLKRLEVITKD